MVNVLNIDLTGVANEDTLIYNYSKQTLREINLYSIINSLSIILTKTPL